MSAMILESVLISLLSVTISKVWRLNRRLKILRKTEQEIKPALTSFSQTMTEITQRVETLKSGAADVHEKIAEQLPKAQILREDFHSLMKEGEKLAVHLASAYEGNDAINSPPEPVIMPICSTPALRAQIKGKPLPNFLKNIQRGR